MKSSITASPLKSAAEELDFLRHLFQSTLAAYGTGIEADISKIREVLGNAVSVKKLSAARVSDARDIVTLIRTLELKPEKGRRRDLKKIETVVADLKQIVENWQG